MASTKERLISKHTKNLIRALKALKRRFDGISEVLRIISEATGGDALENPALGGLTQLLGNNMTAADIMLLKAPAVITVIQHSGLNSRYTHLINSRIIRDEINTTKKYVKNQYRLMRTAPNKKVKTDRRIRWYIATVYLGVLTEIIWPAHLDHYQSLRLSEKKIRSENSKNFKSELKDALQEMLDAYKAYSIVYANKQAASYKAVQKRTRDSNRYLHTLLDYNDSPINPKEHHQLISPLLTQYRHKGVQFYDQCKQTWKKDRPKGNRLKKVARRYKQKLNLFRREFSDRWKWEQEHISPCAERNSDGTLCSNPTFGAWTCHVHGKFRKKDVSPFTLQY